MPHSKAPTAPSSATSMSALIDTKIAFSSDLHLAPSLSRPGDREIYVMNSDGTGQTRLTKNAAMDTNPSWSPDGTKIAFSSEGFLTTGRRSGRTDIYVMNSDGGDLTRITYLTESAGGPSWSPDGTKIAFDAYHPPPNPKYMKDIFVMNADGTGKTRLTKGRSPSWSPFTR